MNNYSISMLHNLLFAFWGVLHILPRFSRIVPIRQNPGGPFGLWGGMSMRRMHRLMHPHPLPPGRIAWRAGRTVPPDNIAGNKRKGGFHETLLS